MIAATVSRVPSLKTARRTPITTATKNAASCSTPRSFGRGAGAAESVGGTASMLRWLSVADKEEKIEFEGEVIESFRSGMYRIQLDNGHETLGYTSGRMRRYRIRINPGDHVKVELSPYDLTRGRIVYRNK